MLKFNSVKLETADFKYFATMTQLSELRLEDCAVTDNCLASLAGDKYLKVLFVPRSGVTKIGVKSIGEMKALRQLDLNETKVSDEEMKHIAVLENLQRLRSAPAPRSRMKL